MANWSKAAQAIRTASDLCERVGELAREAAEAGDHARVETCEIALGCGLHVNATDIERGRALDACALLLAAAEQAQVEVLEVEVRHA